MIYQLANAVFHIVGVFLFLGVVPHFMGEAFRQHRKEKD